MTIDWNKYEGYREVTAFPSVYAKDRFNLPDMRRAMQKAEVLFRGWPFINLSHRPEETFVAGDNIVTQVDITSITGYDSYEFLALKQSGLFFHRRLMYEESYDKAKAKGKVLDIVGTVYHVSEAIASLWRLYEALAVPDDEILTIQFNYRGLKDRELVILDPGRMPPPAGYICRISEYSVVRNLTISTWRSSDADLATEISCDIFNQFQWLDPNPEIIKKMVSKLLAKL
jgi:hypothetical protein